MNITILYSPLKLEESIVSIKIDFEIFLGPLQVRYIISHLGDQSYRREREIEFNLKSQFFQPFLFKYYRHAERRQHKH